MVIRTVLLGIAALGVSVPSLASEEPAVPGAARLPLTAEHRTLLRCSAAFAVASHRTPKGENVAGATPSLTERGREYFVRAGAELIDHSGLTREALVALLEEQARQLSDPDELAAAMPGCIASLEASGL